MDIGQTSFEVVETGYSKRTDAAIVNSTFVSSSPNKPASDDKFYTKAIGIRIPQT